MSLSHKLVLPDLVSTCPFNWSSHPDYERARKESSAWVESFKFFTDRKRRIFGIYNAELLAALANSYAGYEELRTCCDFYNLLFVVDELSDELNGDDTRKLGVILLRALGGEFTQGSALSRMGEDFRLRFIKKAAPKCQERFLARFADYLVAVSKESELRKDGHVLHLGSFIDLRRENSALQPCFALFEYIHGIDLPDEVFEDPVFMRMYWQGADLVWLTNDLFSFSMERAKGLDGNNFLTVAMRHKGLTMQEAADFTGDEIAARVHQFLEDQKKLPSFGKGVDEDVQKYLFSVAQWHIGNLIWSFETPRYFGPAHNEVKKTLIVNVRDRGDQIDSELYEKYSG